MMHFDDRLGTVLRLRADGMAVKRIQYRQLLDLLGTTPVEARCDRLEDAYVRLGELTEGLAPNERAAMVGDFGLRLRSPRLIAVLAQAEPAVAAEAIQRAELSEEQWLDLIPALPPAARTHVRNRRDLPLRVENLLNKLGINSRGLPPAQAVEAQQSPQLSEPMATTPAEAPQAEASAPPAPPLAPEPHVQPVAQAPVAEPPAVLPPQPEPTEPTAIGAIVRRIEAFRRNRQVIEHEPVGDSPRLPLGEEHVLQVSPRPMAFNFATGTDGRINWADPGVGPMVKGIRLGGEQARGPAALGNALAHHQPIRGLAINLEGAAAIAGEWQIDAAPWFDPLGGNYLGHRGRFRRLAQQGGQAPANLPIEDSEAERLRQSLHELRTPVNAIQIGAEIIQQQLYGPTPHEYRALAAAIAGDAARMLSAFEELERLAKLDSRAMELETGATNFVELVEATVAQLCAHTQKRGSGFDLQVDATPLMVGLARIEVERIVWRLLATLAGASAPGEVLKARLRLRRAMVRLDVNLPASLAARADAALFNAAAGAIPQVISAGVFGVGFALRLAQAEAKAAGGKLVRKQERLKLTLPGLTEPGENHTEYKDRAAGGR